ncbi:MAG: WG repeat-containing protein [Clostridia bacterium]|nr:WG repeat-containing protein [Clostridia bacterium]
MRKKSLAITLFAVGFCAMVIVAAIAITQNKPVEPNPPWQELPFDKPNQNLANNLYPAYIEKGKWGYIDASGAWAIEPMYEEALDFTGKVAWVKLNGKWGAVDKSGKPVIEINTTSPVMWAMVI